MSGSVTTLTERGQVSMPSSLRRQLGLRPGQPLLWRRVSNRELRVTVPRKGQGSSMRGFMKKYLRRVHLHLAPSIAPPRSGLGAKEGHHHEIPYLLAVSNPKSEIRNSKFPHPHLNPLPSTCPFPPSHFRTFRPSNVSTTRHPRPHRPYLIRNESFWTLRRGGQPRSK